MVDGISVLGPVRAWREERELDLGSPKQRLLLAALVLAEGRVVGRDQLIDVLWDRDPPVTALNVVRTYVSRLRAALGPGLIVSVGDGYRLAPVVTDLAEFERLRAEGQPARALALWQGTALSGLSGGYAQAHRDRLESLRLATLERRIEADLDAGASVTAELTVLVAAHPLRERLRGLLMLALYREGRQSDAIEVFTQTRRLLDAELGVSPSPELGELYQRIITADPTLSPSTAQRPAQLPPDLPDFTGRTGILDDLVTRTPAVTAISGLGGAGKTALAVHAAHLLRERFPDGQLHVDLRGAGPEPVEPALALERFLEALGASRIPASLEERSALLRTLTADRRVLVLLDNAAGAAQVRPLLPAGAGCAVLVTSRARLTDLVGAVPVELGVLREEEAVDLFTAIAGDRAEAAAIVKECGCLPLAVRITAARLAARPRWSAGALLERLRDERRRLAELSVGDLAVEASFALSYDQLGAEQARALRRLAVPDSADLPLALAAAVLGSGEAGAEELCESLVDLSLLEPVAPGRYRLHDLVRAFALSRTEVEERRSALETVQAQWLAAVADAAARADTDADARDLLLNEASCLLAMDTGHRGEPDPELTLGSTLVVARALRLLGALDPPRTDPFSAADPRTGYARGLLALGQAVNGTHEIVHGKAALRSALEALGR